MSETAENEVSIGKQFKQAREAANLTTEEVSSQLHLKLTIVESLEAEDFDSLAGPTYVRGYIRSYAKTLKLDPEPLIYQYNQLYSEEKTPEILPKVSQHSQISSQDKPVKLFTYLLSFGLVILLLIWWQGNNVVIPVDDNIETEEPEYSGVPPAFDYEFDVIFHDAPMNEPITESMIEESLPLESNEQELSLVIADIDDISTEDNQTAIEIAPSEIITELTEDSIDTGDSVVRFVLSQDSWIEVNDANNERLYINIAKAGEELELRGKAPIRVILGNAPGVTVNYQGNDFDTSSYQRAGIARFTLE